MRAINTSTSLKPRKPIIGITCGEVHNTVEPWSPIMHGQSATYIHSIVEAGGIPILLPLSKDEQVLHDVYRLIDGLCLAGGNDISPDLYGQKPYPGNYFHSALRDHVEQRLLGWALQDTLPILGICRGMQMLNIYRGGTLHQHIPTDCPGAIDHNASTKAKTLEDLSHIIRLEPTSKLWAILGVEQLGTNAHHHQAINRLGEDILVSAWTDDSIVEGLELQDYPYAIGVQSHPESLTAVEPVWKKLFASFVDATKPSCLKLDEAEQDSAQHNAADSGNFC